MRFAVLGPVQIEGDAGVRQLSAGPQRLLLAVLLSRAGGPVAVSQLVDALWPDDPSAKAVKNVQSYLTRLKRQLDAPERIALGPAGYAIEVRPGELDAQEFAERLEQAAAARDAGDLDRAMSGYDQALSLWRGDPYAGLESCPSLAPEIERLTELRLSALEDRADVGLRLGRHTELVPELSALVTEHPYRERFCALLMLALYRSGRQADALTAYRRTRTRLDEDLGIDPGPALRDLHEAVLRSDVALDPVTEPIPKSPQPAQLPPDLASLTGRGTELEELLDLAASAERSGTVVISSIDGMAGIGKTALALHTAHRLRERFPDGQLWINLHGFTRCVAAVEPLLALDRLLRAIGVPGEQIPGGCDERSALWRSRLVGRRMLIVLDNAASEDQVQPLLPASPGCLVLITSRRRLTDLDDVHPLTLDVLSPPDAIALFTRIVGEDRLTTESRQLIEEVVEFCGGLPLAIRILATRLRNRPSWTVADLADRLRDKQSRLGQIETARRSVAGTFRLSYDQLDAVQQRLFRLTGMHPGAVFDTYAAAALTGLDLRETEHGLEALVDAHLLQTRGYGRYIFHDLLRAHAAEIAASEESESERRAALGRLLDYYLYAASRAMDQYLPSERKTSARGAAAGYSRTGIRRRRAGDPLAGDREAEPRGAGGLRR